ncbi:hypothetical protein BDZ89DRAFT_1061396 [Hymenopellis radicata]|nr:hypothetical protein BDZ89DRAFT_1061396 [Hymenopellis radicata]
MKLLYWGTVRPEAASDIAALRFTTPLHITLIRVFSSEAQPFANCPEIVAQTEPDAFYLDIFFNAMPGPLVTVVDKDKRNALVPTSIVYTGGTVDFPMDMGTDYSTRLMIIKGSFQVLSFALYGETVSQLASSPSYEPITLPTIDPVPLSKAVDPANAADPTFLAKNLLKMIPDAPPLPLVIRLMYCLKPTDDDWENETFPYHGTSLDFTEDLDLAQAGDMISRPLRRETTETAISAFASRVNDLIGSKSLTQSDNIARLFSASASQIPSLALALCLHIDPEMVFDAQTLDDSALLYLLDAVANADLARHCGSEEFTGILTQCLESPTSDKATKTTARRLIDRIHAWSSLEDALSNMSDEYDACIGMIKDIGTEEKSLGIWLESMVLHQDLVTKLAENSVPSSPVYPSSSGCVNHDGFITYVRAFIGVATVFVVWAWADSIGHDECRERTLAIVRLWQNVEGYREITNHLLSLRQFSRRLKWIITPDYDGDPPRRAGCIGEQIISELANDPKAIEHELFRETILSLTPPLSFISEGERTRLRKSAFVADDGLLAAMDEVFFKSDRPGLSLRRLHVLRVSLATITREFMEDEEGELRVIQAAWDGSSMGLLPQLISLLTEVSNDLNKQFSLTISPPPRRDSELTHHLFSTGHDLLCLLLPLTLVVPLIPRSTRDLVCALVELFSCTGFTSNVFAHSTCILSASDAARQGCLDLIRQVSRFKPTSSAEKPLCQVVLGTLLECSTQSHDVDPVHRIGQILVLFDHVLTLDEEIMQLVPTVLPSLLAPMKAFFRVLNAEKKVHVMDRLIKLDDGVIGIAEWLLIEEIKVLLQTLNLIRVSDPDTAHVMAHKCHASIMLQFLAELVKASSNWFLATLKDVADVHANLKSVMTAFLDGGFRSLHFSQLVGELCVFIDATDFGDLVPELAIGYLARVQTVERCAWDVPVLRRVLVWSAAADSAALRQEMGRSLRAVAGMEEPAIDMVEGAIVIVEWLLAHKSPEFVGLSGMTLGDSMKVEEFLESVVMEDQAHVVRGFKKLSIDEDEVLLPDPIELSPILQSIPTPSTPKGTITPDVLGSVVVSPPNALLYSPLASTLTKNYANNDFRELRQATSSRQNTSRLPSMHVDEFVLASPELLPSLAIPRQ